jgi:vesicular inhibitory amino acid transporter
MDLSHATRTLKRLSQTDSLIFSLRAKILARIMLDDPRLRSYSDIGLKAFGPRSTLLTGALFCLELFTVRSIFCTLPLFPRLFIDSVLLVTLSADSLHTVAPTYSANTYKVMGLVLFVVHANVNTYSC